MQLLKQCKNCEFNSSGICIGHGDTYEYGGNITDDTQRCDDWGADAEYFSEIISSAPWYLKILFNASQISYSKLLELLEEDMKGLEIEIDVNIYDAIKNIYQISLVDLATVLDVSFGVIHRARSISTPKKRLKHFSETLCIPSAFFEGITTLNLKELAECKQEFTNSYDVSQIGTAFPPWKKSLAQELSNLLSCPIHIAEQIARVDRLNWKPNSKQLLSESEHSLIKVIEKYGQKQGKKHLTSLEYSLDIGAYPHIYMTFY